jgi:hypothetical protein
MARARTTWLVGIFSLAVLMVGLAPVTAHAQEGTQTPVPHRQTVSTNPLGLMFEWFNAEYERKLSPRVTWGVSGAYLSVDSGEFDYTNGNVMFRFYPQGAALSGFFIGSRTGVYHVADDFDSAVFFGLGVEVGYNWLLGADRNFDISIGLGVNRLFGGELDGATLTLPSLRLVNIGYSF